MQRWDLEVDRREWGGREKIDTGKREGGITGEKEKERGYTPILLECEVS